MAVEAYANVRMPRQIARQNGERFMVVFCDRGVVGREEAGAEAATAGAASGSSTDDDAIDAEFEVKDS